MRLATKIKVFCYCSPPKVKKVINIVLLIKKDIQDKSVYKFAEL